MSVMKRLNYQLIIMCFTAFIGKVLLTPLGFHVDLLSNAGWGTWIYFHGPKTFYANTQWIYSWPNHPPLIDLVYGFEYFLYFHILEFLRFSSSYIIPHLAPGHMRWWFRFTVWFDRTKYLDTNFPIGYLMTMKLLPILADIIITVIIYYLAYTLHKTRAIYFSILYLLSPFSWYISSFWGQSDQLSYLFLLIAFIILTRKKLILSTLFFVISVSLKPTTLIFGFIYLYVYFKQRPSKLEMLYSLIISLFVVLASILPFVNKNIFVFIWNDVLAKTFFKSEFRLSTNAFNFWRIFIGNNNVSQDAMITFFPVKIFGFAVFILINFLAVLSLRKTTIQSVMVAMFLVGAGSWLFLTNMLDRYFFAGIVSGLIVSIYQIKVLKYWLVLSLIYWLNLFHGWWFPPVLDGIKEVLIWQNGFVTRILSAVSVVVFFRMVWLVIDIKQLLNVTALAEFFKVVVKGTQPASRITKKIPRTLTK